MTAFLGGLFLTTWTWAKTVHTTILKIPGIHFFIRHGLMQGGKKMCRYRMHNTYAQSLKWWLWLHVRKKKKKIFITDNNVWEWKRIWPLWKNKTNCSCTVLQITKHQLLPNAKKRKEFIWPLTLTGAKLWSANKDMKASVVGWVSQGTVDLCDQDHLPFATGAGWYLHAIFKPVLEIKSGYKWIAE